MIAEELEVDWSTIHVEQAPTIPSIYQGLRTGSSGGVASTFTPMRQVGAQARVVLITAAAQQWKAKKRDCRAENGTVVHGPTNRRLSYGELVEAASELPLINPDAITLKQPKDFHFIGKPIPRTDVLRMSRYQREIARKLGWVNRNGASYPMYQDLAIKPWLPASRPDVPEVVTN